MLKSIGQITLTKDAEIRYANGQNGQFATARGSFATDKPYRKNRAEGEATADFFNFAATGHVAELLEKFGRKGQSFLADGYFENNNYEKDGQTVYAIRFVITSLEFLKGGKKAEGNNNSAAPSPQPASSPQPAPQSTVADGFMNIPEGIDEELPFN